MAKPSCLQVFPKYNPSFLGDQKQVLSIKSSLHGASWNLYVIVLFIFKTVICDWK